MTFSKGIGLFVLALAISFFIPKSSAADTTTVTCSRSATNAVPDWNNSLIGVWDLNCDNSSVSVKISFHKYGSVTPTIGLEIDDGSMNLSIREDLCQQTNTCTKSFNNTLLPNWPAEIGAYILEGSNISASFSTSTFDGASTTATFDATLAFDIVLFDDVSAPGITFSSFNSFDSIIMGSMTNTTAVVTVTPRGTFDPIELYVDGQLIGVAPDSFVADVPAGATKQYDVMLRFPDPWDPFAQPLTQSILLELSGPVPPSVALTSNTTGVHAGAFVVTASFSEDVTGFDVTDVVVNNGVVSNFTSVSASVYRFDVTPTADGAVTVDIAANVAVDAAGLNNTAATQLSVTTDGTTPTVALTSNANAPHSGSFTVTATFSEAVTGFALGDVTVGNGSASNFDDSNAPVYTFDVTPAADGAVTVDIAANVAEDAAGNNNTAATQLSVNADNIHPVVTISGPTEVVVDDFTVTLTFSEVVTGFAAGDVTVTNGEKGTFTETTVGQVFTLVVIPELGTTVAVSVPANKAQDAAGNGNEASDVLEVSASSPASEFEKESADIKKDIVAEVKNTLQNAVTANVRMVKEAKSRFIANTKNSPNGPAGFAGQNNVPFDLDGVANGTAMRLSTKGTFFGQVGNDEGTKRRVFFGDFSIFGEKGGSVTGSISGKVAWEQNLSDKTMYGYFIGAQVNQTDIKTTFKGKQQGYGVNIGSYVVNEVAENVYIDGFVSLGVGKSDLDMSNDVLSLDGTYETKSVTIGGAVTGVYDMESYELWPELAFTAGKTQIGTAKFTGRAYGLVDNNLSLDAGDVTVANLILRPEVRIPLKAGNPSGGTAQVTFAPRAICERITTDVTTENCGRGAEFGFIRRSGDGFTQITGRLSRDYVGSSTRTGLELKLEHRF